MDLKYFANKSLLVTHIKNDIKTKFHPKDFSQDWIITHELGHNVFSSLLASNEKKAKEIWKTVMEAKKSGELVKWGEYADSDELGMEGIAEVFASIYHTPAQDQPQFVKDVAEILSRK